MNTLRKYIAFSALTNIYRKYYLNYLLLFSLVFTLFFWWGYSLNFPDPDSFYHVKIAQLISQQGAVLDFPWQQFTLLKDNYVDHHLLYHLLLIPFVKIMDPLVGAKIATFFLASGFILVFYFFLQQNKIKGAWYWALYLALITPFSFRLNLTKASALSLIILYLGFYLIVKGRLKLLFIISFLYVWAYGGFALLLLIALVYFLVDLIKNKKNNIKTLGVILGGLNSGLIINPYFPKNIAFYWQQLIQIGVLNYQDKIGVGGEWYSYGFFNLISGTITLSLGLIISLVIFIKYFKKQTAFTITSLLLYFFFFLLTLKSRRYIEYFGPAALLFVATQITLLSTNINYQKYLTKILASWSYKIILGFLIFYLALMLPIILIKDISINKQDLRNGFAFNKFKPALDWLGNHTAPGAIIMHSDWDEWPLLFYHNTYNYYLVGLDPTFMYNYNAELYWKWVNITLGKTQKNLEDIITNDFQAQYVFLETDHKALDTNLLTNPHFKLVYQDAQAKIYQIKTN